MSRRPARLTPLARLAATVGVSAALAMGVAPAQAVTYDHQDAVGDVRGIDITSNEDEVSLRAQERSADITELRVRHGKSRLIIRMETVDLTRRGSFVLGSDFAIRTPQRRYRASVSAFSNRRETTRSVELQRASGKSVRCKGLFTDFDFSGDVAMVSVPRRCIGDPRRVTVGAAMLKIDRNFEEIVVDSAMNTGIRYLKRTPWIRSGPLRAV